MLAPNTLLQNRYRIKRQLAQGGMGAIYEAEAVHLGGTIVAVKETFYAEEYLRQQFQREASMLAKLRHPVLPKVSDHFSEGTGQFLVMEFIPGKDLLKLLEGRGTPFEPRFVMEWAVILLDTLDYIHTQNPPVIHRDIKPENLKLTPRGELFLLDFGLAKNATTPTRSGGSLHAYTLSYASPEQIKGTGTDARSDLYSLGATLYHLLTGELPPNAQVREAVVNRTGADLLEEATALQTSSPLKTAIVKAMALNSADRYQSASDMRQALIAEQQREEERRHQEQERQREIEAQQQREKEAQLQAEGERLAQENTELKKWLAEKHRQEEAEQQRRREEADLQLVEQRYQQELAEKQRQAEEKQKKQEQVWQREVIEDEDRSSNKFNQDQTKPKTAEPDQSIFFSDKVLKLTKNTITHFSVGFLVGVVFPFVVNRCATKLFGYRMGIDIFEKFFMISVISFSLLAITGPYIYQFNRKLILIISSIVGMALLGTLSYQVWKKPATSPSTVRPVATSNVQTFSFETVKLDTRGKEMARETKQARYFTEDFGNGVMLEMVAIPGGTFTMGAPDSEKERRNNEEPQHRITVPAFSIGKYEVTQAQWMAVMSTDPSSFKGDNLPVETVTWNDAKEFCAQLTKKAGKAYRLPSEAEWEYAARAGTTTPFAFGETITPQIVNYGGNNPYASAAKGLDRRKTVPVGSLGVANTFGLFDLHGNVYELCEDAWHENFNGAPTDGSAWTSNGDQELRVVRGGSLYSTGGECRVTYRNRLGQSVRYDAVGFRVVVSARTQ